MHVRKSVHQLTVDEVLTLRSAFRGVYGVSGANPGDERGYHYFAGLHGLPLPSFCEHGTLLFLPWHRAYLYFFELALREIEPTAFVPWWDWTSAVSHTEGLPGAYTDAAADNPLAAGPMWLPAADVALVASRMPQAIDLTTTPPRTRRRPGQPGFLPSWRTPGRGEDWFNVDLVLSASSFEDFSMRMEDIHGGMHVWTGGSMGQVPVAAFDPIFWTHHTMVDRLWYLWQLRHTAVGPEPWLLDQVLTPFNVTVRDVINIGRLDYEYAASTITL